MESDDIKSPFDTPEEIFLLEYLISSGYLIAEYRNSENNDSESYLISTMGHAYMRHYSQSWIFRLRANIHYYRIIYGLIIASMVGSLIANVVTAWYIQW
jgi:hypothetical protein